MTKKNLGSMFAPGSSEDPTKGLQGLLPAKKPSVKAQTPSVQTPGLADHPAGSQEAASTVSPAPQKRAVKPPHSSAYLPANVYKALRKESMATAQSYTELFFRGLGRVSKVDLAACFGSSTVPGLPEGMPGATPMRKRRGGGEGGTQIQLRLSAEQVAWIDNVYCAEVSAPNRSALVSALFALDLKADVPQYS